MKYKAPVRLRGETCHSPHTVPALIAIIMYYLFERYRIWGSHSDGGKTPVSVWVFINQFSKSPKNALRCFKGVTHVLKAL
jgi:hypothetical protein